MGVAPDRAVPCDIKNVRGRRGRVPSRIGLGKHLMTGVDRTFDEENGLPARLFDSLPADGVGPTDGDSPILSIADEGK